MHAATAVIELIILLGALRVWRLGRTFADDDVSEMFSMSAGSPMVAAVAARSDEPATPKASATWLIGLLALALARTHDLVPTGGSDFHGRGEHGAPLGGVFVPPDTVARLEARYHPSDVRGIA